MSLDPQFADFLGFLESVGAPASFAGTPEEMRARTAQAIESGWDESAFADVESIREAVVGSVPTRVTITTPRGARGRPVPTVVYFHPGGFVVGSPHLFQDVTRRLASDLGAVVVSVDYRLSPEAPHPAPAQDATSVLDWVFDHVDELGGDRGRIAVAGESSGANLAAVAALHAREAGLPLAAQLLASPVTDFTRELPSYVENADGYFLTRDDLAVIRELHFTDPAAASGWTASPARAGSIAGVAPAIIAVAGYDPLRDDGIVYAGRLLDAGVSVTLRVYDTLIHPFFGMPGVSAAANRAVEELTDELRRLLGVGGSGSQ